MSDVSSEYLFRSIQETDFETLLAEEIFFEGEMHFSHPVVIKGTFKGSIVSDSALYVSESAVVTGNVSAHIISIKGQIEGDVKAARRLELYKNSKVRGSIEAPDVLIQSGARFNGQCTMEDEVDMVREVLTHD